MYKSFIQDTDQPTCHDLKEARQLAGLSLQQAAELSGIHRTTYARQETGKTRVNIATYRLLNILDGVMPWQDWHGWKVNKGKLYAPNDPRAYTKEDLNFYSRELVRELKKKNQQLITALAFYNFFLVITSRTGITKITHAKQSPHFTGDSLDRKSVV